MLKTSMKLTWNGGKVIQKGYDTVNKSAVEIAIGIQGQAVQLCPRDLSRLVKSIIIQTKKETLTNSAGLPETDDYISKPTETNVWLIGTNVEYAKIQEYGGTINHPGGTAYLTAFGGSVWIPNSASIADQLPRTKPHLITIPAQPYLRPAFDLYTGKSVTILKENGKNIFADYIVRAGSPTEGAGR